MKSIATELDNLARIFNQKETNYQRILTQLFASTDNLGLERKANNYAREMTEIVELMQPLLEDTTYDNWMDFLQAYEADPIEAISRLS